MIKAKWAMLPITQVSSSCFDWNRQGFLALPDDTYETYAKRVAKLQAASPCAPTEYPIQIYDINPSWVSVEYSNEDLRAWEAGCTWFGDSADIPPTIQLNSSFEHASTYLGIYNKDEVLSHEYVHAIRAPLGSSAFEEIFAYLLSYTNAKSPFSKLALGFRTALGPLFKETWESLLLVILFALLLLLTIADCVVDSSLLSHCMVAMASLSFAAFAYLIIRLAVRWWQWWRCKRHLDSLMGASCLPLMVRLVDEEIILFSRQKPQAIQAWIASQNANFRWQLLSGAYLK